MESENIVEIQSEKQVQEPLVKKQLMIGFKIAVILCLVSNLLACVYDIVVEPWRNEDSEHFDNDLLIGISSGVKDFELRKIIRTNQIAPYANLYPNVEWVFFIANPNKEEKLQIEEENQVHSDIVVLQDVEDSRVNARSIKPFYFFQAVEKRMGKKYRYVAKMDDDTIVNLPLMMKEYFNERTWNSTHHYIGTMLWAHIPNCTVSMGWFYALSWDLVLTLNQLFITKPRRLEEEDFQVGLYICEAYERDVEYGITDFSTQRCHDLDPDLPDTDDFFKHTIRADKTVCVHQMRRLSRYIPATKCLAEIGYNQTCLDEIHVKGFDN